MRAGQGVDSLTLGPHPHGSNCPGEVAAADGDEVLGHQAGVLEVRDGAGVPGCGVVQIQLCVEFGV